MSVSQNLFRKTAGEYKIPGTPLSGNQGGSYSALSNKFSGRGKKVASLQDWGFRGRLESNTQPMSVRGRLSRKLAAGGPYEGYSGLSHQQFLPIHARRVLSPDETDLIRSESRKVLPKIFHNKSDSPAVRMSSPLLPAAALGAITSVPGTIAGAMLGGATGIGVDAESPGNYAAGGAILGGLMTGSVGAILGYKLRNRENLNLEEGMRRLPEGATIRDYESDPLYQKERDQRLRVLR